MSYSLAIGAYIIIMAIITGIFLILDASQYQDCGNGHATENIMITLIELFVFSIASFFIIKSFFYNFSGSEIITGLAILSLLLFLITTLPAMKSSYGYCFSERFYAGMFNVSAYQIIICYMLNIESITTNYLLMILSYSFIFFVIHIGVYLWNIFFPQKKVLLRLYGSEYDY